MEVDDEEASCGTDVSMDEDDWSGRWDPVKKLLERPGPFSHATFEPSPEIFRFIRTSVKVLVIGAGGLGCELLKNLALMGFRKIHVIDMDTIDISNLNRQFLFRQKDVGRYKAEVAAEFVNQRVSGACVVAHNCKIQDMDETFYSQFQMVVCGLDSVVARRWINGMMLSLLDYDDQGQPLRSSMIPIIDGGTEGFKGNARVIIPGMTACIDCTLDLFPPQVNFPLCTIAHTPRLPEHCIEYVRVLLWPKEDPFGLGAGETAEVPIDGDDPAHISWICERAQERAAQFNISGVTYRLTQGVVKHIIPAVASTNAVIAAEMAMETFKVATGCANPLQNYMVFNQADSIYTYSYEASRNENCLACSNVPQVIQVKPGDRLQDVIQVLTSPEHRFQMRAPGLTTTSDEGKNKTLYMSSVTSIEEATRPNLKKALSELGLRNGSEIMVADVTSPSTISLKLQFQD